jgi:hypothetical protein
MRTPVLLLLALVLPLAAQDDNQAKYESKLQGAWLKRAPWITDYDAARAAAEDKGLPILAYFTRSYAP